MQIIIYSTQDSVWRLISFVIPLWQAALKNCSCLILGEVQMQHGFFVDKSALLKGIFEMYI